MKKFTLTLMIILMIIPFSHVNALEIDENSVEDKDVPLIKEAQKYYNEEFIKEDENSMFSKVDGEVSRWFSLDEDPIYLLSKNKDLKSYEKNEYYQFISENKDIVDIDFENGKPVVSSVTFYKESISGLLDIDLEIVDQLVSNHKFEKKVKYYYSSVFRINLVSFEDGEYFMFVYDSFIPELESYKLYTRDEAIENIKPLIRRSSNYFRFSLFPFVLYGGPDLSGETPESKIPLYFDIFVILIIVFIIIMIIKRFLKRRKQ